MTRKKINHLPCADCGINTSHMNDGQSEFYMVTEETWRAAGTPPATDIDADFLSMWQVDGTPPPTTKGYDEFDGNFLCIGCLETRLGRTLTPGDFTDCPINDPRSRAHTPRLRSRLTGDAALGQDLRPSPTTRRRPIASKPTPGVILGHCRAGGRLCEMHSLGRRRPIYTLQPPGIRVPWQYAIEAIKSGKLKPAEGGLFKNHTQSWIFGGAAP